MIAWSDKHQYEVGIPKKIWVCPFQDNRFTGRRPQLTEMDNCSYSPRKNKTPTNSNNVDDMPHNSLVQLLDGLNRSSRQTDPNLDLTLLQSLNRICTLRIPKDEQKNNDLGLNSKQITNSKHSSYRKVAWASDIQNSPDLTSSLMVTYNDCEEYCGEKSVENPIGDEMVSYDVYGTFIDENAVSDKELQKYVTDVINKTDDCNDETTKFLKKNKNLLKSYPVTKIELHDHSERVKRAAQRRIACHSAPADKRKENNEYFMKGIETHKYSFEPGVKTLSSIQEGNRDELYPLSRFSNQVHKLPDRRGSRMPKETKKEQQHSINCFSDIKANTEDVSYQTHSALFNKINHNKDVKADGGDITHGDQKYIQGDDVMTGDMYIVKASIVRTNVEIPISKMDLNDDVSDDDDGDHDNIQSYNTNNAGGFITKDSNFDYPKEAVRINQANRDVSSDCYPYEENLLHGIDNKNSKTSFTQDITHIDSSSTSITKNSEQPLFSYNTSSLDLDSSFEHQLILTKINYEHEQINDNLYLAENTNNSSTIKTGRPETGRKNKHSRPSTGKINSSSKTSNPEKKRTGKPKHRPKTGKSSDKQSDQSVLSMNTTNEVFVPAENVPKILKGQKLDNTIKRNSLRPQSSSRKSKNPTSAKKINKSSDTTLEREKPVLPENPIIFTHQHDVENNEGSQRQNKQMTTVEVRKRRRIEEAEKRRLEVEKKRQEKRQDELENARRNDELRLAIQKEQEDAEDLAVELKRLEEEQLQKEEVIRKCNEHNQKQLKEDEKRKAEEAIAKEKVELERLQQESFLREQLIRSAEEKVRILRQEKARKEQLELLEAEQLEVERQRSLKQEEVRRREEVLKAEVAKTQYEEEMRQSMILLENRRREALVRRQYNLEKRKSLSNTKRNQMVTRSNIYSYFVQVPRQVWELPLGWQKRPSYKAGGRRAKSS